MDSRWEFIVTHPVAISFSYHLQYIEWHSNQTVVLHLYHQNEPSTLPEDFRRDAKLRNWLGFPGEIAWLNAW